MLDLSAPRTHADTAIGTWLDSDASLQNGQIIPPSNVTRITRAIRSQSSDGIQQIVYYQAGVGSIGTAAGKTVGGISGWGLAEHVREAYSFLANNWNRGDEIFLIGFSRGAFTARSVGGLISQIGVMTKNGLHTFPVVYQASRMHTKSISAHMLQHRSKTMIGCFAQEF